MAMQMQELEAGKKGETIFHSDLRYFNVAYPPIVRLQPCYLYAKTGLQDSDRSISCAILKSRC